jgi:hypothetical protein
MLKLALLMIFLGGAGGAVGAVAGKDLGPGGLIGGGFFVGALLVVAAGFLATRWEWIHPQQRLWAILGGVFGFGLAFMVLLSTLASPLSPILCPLMIGVGAVLGAVVGKSPHAHA